MSAIRYRTGIDRNTGQVLTGWPHLCQSLGVIWTTTLGRRVMRLDFGTSLRSWLAEDINTETALGIYDELITSAEAYEPEYRIKELQLLRIARDGTLGLRHAGIYYPEGRYGNYSIALPVGSRVALTAAAIKGRSAQ